MIGSAWLRNSRNGFKFMAWKLLNFEHGEIISNIKVLDRSDTKNKEGCYLWNVSCSYCGKTHHISSRTLVLAKRNTRKNLCPEKISHDPIVPAKIIYQSYIHRATRKNISCTIGFHEWYTLTQSPCHYCGALKSNKTSIKKYKQFTYNGLDRINNSKGYDTDNVVPCCVTCNRAKLKMTYYEFLEWVLNVYNYAIKRALHAKSG